MTMIEIKSDLLKRLQIIAEYNGKDLEEQIEAWIEAEDRTTQELQQSQMRLQALFDNALDAILLADDQGRYLDANPAALQMLGYSREELLSLSVGDVSVSLDEKSLKLWERFAANGHLRGEYTVKRKDGTFIECDFAAVMNILPGVHMSIIRDITKRKQAEYALRESELRFRAIYENELIGVIIVTEDGTIISANLGACKLVGYSEAELQKIGRSRLLDENDPAVQEAFRLRRQQGFVRFETLIRHADGTKIPVETTSSIYGSGEDRLVMVVFHDLREQLQTTEYLARSEQRFRTLFAHAPVGILVVDVMGRIRQANRQAEVIFGYDEGELQDRQVDVLVPYDIQSRHTQYRKEFFQHPHSHPMGLETDIYGIHKDGSQVPVEVVLGNWEIDGEQMILTFITDVTQRRQIQETHRTSQLLELELKRERELREVKMQFLSMVAHQFKTPLTVILSSTGLAGRYHNDYDKQKPHLVKIEAQVKRLEKMVESVSIVSKNELVSHDLQLNVLGINEFITKIIDETLIVYPKNVNVQLDTAPECGELAFDGRLMDEILTNLITNAVKYTPDGGEVRVQVLCDGDDVIIRVQDTGIGIPAKDQKKLFDAFFRAGNSHAEVGSGLGLAIVKAAVDAYQGTIYFESVENEGTLFEVILPRFIRTEPVVS